MGWKSSITIHLGFWLYLVGGGLIYYYIENPMYHLPPAEKRKANEQILSFSITYIPGFFKYSLMIIKD